MQPKIVSLSKQRHSEYKKDGEERETQRGRAGLRHMRPEQMNNETPLSTGALMAMIRPSTYIN